VEEKVTIILDQKQILELEGIIMDRDKEAALKYLREYVYELVQKKKQGHCKPPF